MADIVYTYGGKVYLNITNKCPCNCTFCIRANGDGVGSAENLWHKSDPTLEEIKKAIDSFDFSQYDEVTFCGYGEPTYALDNLIAACKYIRSKYKICIRLNTNGLSDLINKRETAREICENFDVISISLNAPTPEKYLEISRPVFGIQSFDEIIKFTKTCKKYTNCVKMSVVDVIPQEDIDECRKITDKLGVELRVREYTD
ncbi:MAG: TIGR04100 family radical SAM protein [Clostridiales bacterium]|nr:TIGR04100 family radical SAM protein [Clostridiales bacterium]